MRKNNIGIIDLGSNLTKLVVVSDSLPLHVIHRSVYDTKTLKSAPKGFFDSASIDRIQNDMEKILAVAKSLDCSTILGIATSAFRTRKNGKEVIAEMNKRFHINIQIIEGEREAQLIYKGALASVTPKTFPVLVMDIGGGSTEFIIGTESEILWKHSFDFGSTALTKGLDIANPLSLDNISALNAKLEKMLPLIFTALSQFSPKIFIGTTGAFESFAQITETAKGNPAPVQSGFKYNEIELTAVIKTLITSSTEIRRNLEGMNPLRVPTINIAALILNFVLDKFSAESYQLSLGDVKEGLALEYLESR